MIVFSEYPSADASYQIATPLVRATNLLLLIKIFLSTEDRFGIDECANRQAICACADLPRPVLRGLRAELIILGLLRQGGGLFDVDRIVDWPCWPAISYASI